MSASTRPYSVQQASTPSSSFVRRRELPALGLPRARENRKASAVLSVLLHALVVMLLVTPFAVHHAIVEIEQGAGGPGPAGGGGGGHGGTGGVQTPHDRLQFIQVAPPQSTAATPPPEQVVPPTPVPPPEPVKVEVTPAPVLQPSVAVAAPAKLPEIAATPGVGGGTGHDGTNGTGPGTGGGVGTGVGTGRGSGVGPGTGGGNQANYPPKVMEMFIPPMPVPDRARGSRVVAEFDVDSTGHVLSFDFTPTKDGDYNKRLREVFRGFRFRAGTTPEGRPLRMKAQLTIELP
jgi:protein TonB